MTDDPLKKKSILENIDQYTLPIQLKYKMNAQFTSIIGGFCSALIYIFFGALVVYLFVDMADKVNQNIIKFPRRLSSPPRLNLTGDLGWNLKSSPANADRTKHNPSFFFFAITFQNKTTLEQIPFAITDQIFLGELLLIKRVFTTGKTTNEKIYEFVRCGDIYKEFPWDDSTLNEATCLNDTNTIVEGEFVSPIFQYVNIKLKKCRVVPVQTAISAKKLIEMRQILENQKRDLVDRKKVFEICLICVYSYKIKQLLL